jgi:hypothetical protein
LRGAFGANEKGDVGADSDQAGTKIAADPARS